MNTIRSALTWAAIGLLILAFLPWMALVRVFDRDPARYATGRQLRRLGNLITKVNPVWKITRTGTLPANPRNPFVVVCNHQSTSDPPVVSTLPWEMKWVAKASLFKVPVAGWLMTMAGDIPVDRSEGRSRAAVLLKARAMLEKRCSVILMPEGTRSEDGRVRPFQDGAFRLAIELGLPVLPLALDGTADMLPKHGWRFGKANLRLHVFDPISTAEMTVQDAAALRERVRSATIERVAEWRGVLPAEMDGARLAVEEGANSTSPVRQRTAPG